MKTLKYLLVVRTAGGTLHLARAADPVLSTKAAELQDQLRKVPSARGNVDQNKGRPIGKANAWDLVRSFSRVPSAGRETDLAHAPRPTATDRHYEFRLPGERNLGCAEVTITPPVPSTWSEEPTARTLKEAGHSGAHESEIGPRQVSRSNLPQVHQGLGRACHRVWQKQFGEREQKLEGTLDTFGRRAPCRNTIL